MNEINILFDLSVEQALLSSILKDPNILQDISEKININDFYYKQNKIIYEYMLKSTSDSVISLVDITILTNNLTLSNKLDEIGGIEYLEYILDAAPTSSNYNSYLNIIKEYSKKRALYNLGKKINTSITESNVPFNQLLDEVQVDISKLFDEHNSSGTKTIAEILSADIQRYQAKSHKELVKLGTPTDYLVYDELTGGLRATDLIILAARPAMGKTALALNIALNVALKNKKVLIFSLEMGEEQLARRLVCAVSKIPNKEIDDGSYLNNKNKVEAISNAINTLNKLDILIDASSSSSISSIKNSCRNAVRKGKNLDLIIIDYLQLISVSNNSNSREQQISEISRSLKLLAKELKVPIITLSQLSRAVEKREVKRPQLSDLRESGSIEQDADQVMFLYNDNYYERNEEIKDYEEVEWILAKHRNGGLGIILLKFYKSIQKFESASKEEYTNYIRKKDN